MNVSPTSHPDWYERYAYVEDGVLCWGFRLKRVVALAAALNGPPPKEAQ